MSGSAFGPTLAALRTIRGWSQYRLAEMAEIDDSYVSRLETGNRMPGRKVVEKLVVGFGLDGDEANKLRRAAGYADQ
jgi:transcriptional regulator with XRE-family HTH domain